MIKAFGKLLSLCCWLAVAGCASGCGGQLYKVATPPKLPPPMLAPGEGNLFIGAKALSGDEGLAQFEANLLLAGVIAVDVRLVNRATGPLDANTLRFVLRDAGGIMLKPLPPKQALSRVIRYYGNRLYAPRAYQQTLANYEGVALSFRASLASQEERRGFLFFDAKQDATVLTGLVLSMLGQANLINLRLN
jgi:hypothetical protein